MSCSTSMTILVGGRQIAASLRFRDTLTCLWVDFARLQDSAIRVCHPGFPAIPVCFPQDRSCESAANAHKMCIAPAGPTSSTETQSLSEINASFLRKPDARTILDCFRFVSQECTLFFPSPVLGIQMSEPCSC